MDLHHICKSNPVLFILSIFIHRLPDSCVCLWLLGTLINTVYECLCAGEYWDCCFLQFSIHTAAFPALTISRIQPCVFQLGRLHRIAIIFTKHKHKVCILFNSILLYSSICSWFTSLPAVLFVLWLCDGAIYWLKSVLHINPADVWQLSLTRPLLTAVMCARRVSTISAALAHLQALLPRC